MKALPTQENLAVVHQGHFLLNEYIYFTEVAANAIESS